MLEPIRIVPQWKELKGQLRGKLETQKVLPDVAEAVRLSDRPSILFRESCCPSLMPLICFYSLDAIHYFASFTWRATKGGKSKVRLWTYSVEGEAPVAQKDYAMEEDPKVLLMTHAPSRGLFVAFCNDIHLRVFGDHMQDFRLLVDKSAPYAITSMCYSPETSELVTGAIGTLAFWSLGTEEEPSLSVTQTISICSGEFVHFLCVEKERRVLVALCENIILVFDCQNKVKIRALQVDQGVSLTCCSANWLQSCLYAGDLAGDVKVWNFDTGLLMCQFKAHLSAVVSLVTRILVQTLMTASLDGLLKEWNLSTCELLRRVDIGEPVFQLQFINEQTFFLRTQYTFSIRTINNFYQLFNKPNAILKKLMRIQCGPDKARILAVTEDGVIRFLSPVTGEILFVTWPFQLVDKALDFVYDPDQEELLVTMGTMDIYVLDTSKNPCPCKYILRTTDYAEDRVLCLTYSRLDLEGRTFSFIFSGYKSGRVRAVTQHLYRMGSRRIHDGNVVALSSISSSGILSYRSRESSYLCSYGADEYIILSDVILKKNSFLDMEPLVCIPSFQCRINHLLLIPGYICVLTEHNRVRLWRQASLVPGKKNPFWKETSTMHSSSITSFDYCHALSMLVTGGSDGSVRLWDILGEMLVEFDTSLRFSRVCFANQRGDLVVGCNKDIYFISCVTYLPVGHLVKLAARQMRDDVIEYPLPFLPHFLLRFDIVFVPKYYQVGKQSKKFERLEPITNHKEVVMEKTLVRVVEFAGLDASALPPSDFYGAPPAIQDPVPGFATKYQVLPQSPHPRTPEKKSVSLDQPLLQPRRGLPPLRELIPLVQRPPFWTGRSWPIAPDGYVPNSVIRAQMFPKWTPAALQSGLTMKKRPLPQRQVVKVRLEESTKSEYDPLEKAWKKKVQRKKRMASVPEGQRRRDLLADIVAKPWLRHKPSEMTLPCVTKTILDLMDDVPFSTYLMCTAALVQIAETYTLPPEIQEMAFERLMQDTYHKEVRMRVAAWEALGKMDLLDEKDVVPLARALMDENPRVRDLARSLLDSVAGITDKFVLKKEMQRLAQSSLETLSKKGMLSKKGFPRRLRATGIIAETQGDAFNALMEVSQKLVKRVDKRLTANLFLMTEHTPEDSPEQDARSPPGRRRLGSVAQAAEEVLEEAVAEAPEEAKARWLGLFDSAPQQAKSRSAIAIEEARRQQQPKVTKARPVSKESSSAPRLSREFLLESGSSASSSASSTSSSLWQEVRREKKHLKEKGQLPPSLLPGAKAPHSPPQEGRKPPKASKLIQPIPLTRRDTRTQLYSEMLKHQQAKKEQAALAPPPAPKQDSGATPGKGVSSGAPPEPPRGSLIDPNQEYGVDKSKWRNDLLKLLMLRIGPSVEGRTALEDLLASARIALGGQDMSWELFATLSQSILASREKISPQPSKIKKYVAGLFKSFPWELWPEEAESREAVLAVKMGKEIAPSPESKSESSSLESRPRMLDEEEEEEGVGPVRSVAGKRARAEAQGKRRKGKSAMFAAPGKKAARERKKEGAEEEGEDEEEDEASRRVWEAARKKERELARGKEQELARERGLEGAKEREQAVSREKGLEAGKAKEQERGRQRKREAAERRERELPGRRAGGRRFERRGAGVPAGGEELSPEDTWPEERVPSGMTESGLSVSEGSQLPISPGGSTLADLRAKILAEAEEIALAEQREKALAEAQERVLAEMREQALAEARKNILAELREKALAEARERALAEMRASSLAEARERVLSEVMDRALAEAREMALAEAEEGQLDEERVRELAEERMRELAEEKLRELTQFWVDRGRIAQLAKKRAAERAKAGRKEPDEAELLELDEATEEELAKMAELDEAKMAQLDEAKITELVEAKMAELDEAKIAELAEAKVAELDEAKMAALAEAKAAELVEAKMAKLDEAKLAKLAEAKVAELAEVAELEEAKGDEQAETRVWELVKAKLKDLAKVRAMELAQAKLRRPVMGAAAPQDAEGGRGAPTEEGEGEEAEKWEDFQVGEVAIFTEEEKEALVTMLLEERAERQGMTCADRAHLLLDILTKPEELGGSDSQVFQRLFKVVSLLEIPSGLQYKELAEYLLQTAEATVKAGEEEDQSTAKEVSSIYRMLRRVVEAHRAPQANLEEFAARIQALLRAAQLMVRARALKEQLEAGFPQRIWWEKAKRDWQADEGRVLQRRGWVDQRLKVALRKWQAEHTRLELERQEQGHKARRLRLKLQAAPVLLSEGEGERRGGRRQKREVAGREEELRERVVEQQPPAPAPQPKRITWSLGCPQHKAREVILKLEELLPVPQEFYAPPRPKKPRLPLGSLYLPPKPLRPAGPRPVRRGTKPHLLPLPGEAVDWELFSALYQSLVLLREKEGGVESAAWQEQLGTLLGVFGLQNKLIRALIQQLVMGEDRPRKALLGKDFSWRATEANLGERILYHVAHHPGSAWPRLPPLHGVIPLSYRNDVHPFELVGSTRFGTLLLRWKTSAQRRLSRLPFCVQPQPLSK